MKSKVYPVKVGDEIRHVTVPGSGDEEPAPASEQEFETFLAEAVEAYAESSDMPRPSIRTFVEAGMMTRNRGLVVRIGDTEFQVTVVKSR
jgi:hypothetical protein